MSSPTYRLERDQWIPAPLEDVFAFFGDARNLERITPDTLRFEVRTPAPIEMKRGARIDYRLKIRGVPARWQSEITVWEPPRRFVDVQRRGPYRQWHHEYTEPIPKNLPMSSRTASFPKPPYAGIRQP